jgi:putative oxidoreductase
MSLVMTELQVMNRLLGKYSPLFYAVLRIVAGLMFMMNGSQKLFGRPGDGHHMALSSLMGAAGIIEFVCGILITIGFFTACAAFLASGEMAVAYFKQHAPGGLLPITNHGELAVIFCFLFLYMAAQGSGIWSVDSLTRKRK